MAARPTWPIWCWSVLTTIIGCINRGGTPSCFPTEPSRSPTPTVASAPRLHRGQNAHGDARGEVSTRLVSVGWDANDTSRLARFWTGALEWNIDDEDEDEIGLVPTDG